MTPTIKTNEPFNLIKHLIRQKEFSEKTFGPGARTQGVLDHIRKELKEIEASPKDITEWIDVIILTFDGAWRAGWKPEDIVAALVEKQEKNEGRTWPNWKTSDPNKAIEHDRTKDIIIRGCNRHDNCEVAEKARLEKNPGTYTPINFHCHDDDCEDCFGC